MFSFPKEKKNATQNYQTVLAQKTYCNVALIEINSGGRKASV